jgi:hypothetical protein
MFDYTSPNLVNSIFSSLLSSDSCALIPGADQRARGMALMDKNCYYEWREVNFDIKSSDIIAQVAQMSCKKIIILSSTVSDRLSEGYEKLSSHRMIFVKPSYENMKVDAVMIPKDTSDIMLTHDAIE